MNRKFPLYSSAVRIRTTVILSFATAIYVAIQIFRIGAVNSIILRILHGILMAVILIWYVYKIVYFCFPTVEFTEKGLFYNDTPVKYHMDWKDVKAIGLIDYGSKWVLSTWIYFSASGTPVNCVERIMFCNEFIAIQYSQEIYDVVQSYWKEPIQSMYAKNAGISSSS